MVKLSTPEVAHIERKQSVDRNAIENLMDSDSDLDMFNNEILYHLSPKGIISGDLKASMTPETE